MAEAWLSAGEKLTEFLSSDQIDASARRTKFVQRTSKITGKLFVALVTFGRWSTAKTTVAQLAAKAAQLDAPVDITPEALQQRMTARAVTFLQELVQTAFIKLHTGDTICDPGHALLLKGLNVPEPVVSQAVEPKGIEDREKLPPALEKLQWEDPTFRVKEDAETGQTILTGMGELHLEIIADRLARDFGVEVKTGRPQVVYRETVARKVERREVFRREVDGKVQGGEILLRLSPLRRGEGLHVVMPPEEGSPLPAELRATLENSILQSCSAGGLTGYPLTDVGVTVVEAPYEQGITTEIGLRAAAQRCLALAARDASPTLLEPIMLLELIAPSDYTGKVLGSLQQKRGRVEGISVRGDTEVIRAFVPLAEMFGFMTELRSATRGRGTFTMEFSHFDLAPADTLKKLGYL